MSNTPVRYKSTHRISFSDLDPYDHLRTAAYSRYFVDHRMNGLREHLGWDIETIETLPFMVWVRRIEIDFYKPAAGYQEIGITSFVREFQGSDAYIECSMVDDQGTEISRCLMVVAYVDKGTGRAKEWPEEARALFFESASA